MGVARFWERRANLPAGYRCRLLLLLGEKSYRFVRTTVTALLYAFFGYALLYVLDDIPNSPARGTLARGVGYIVLWASVIPCFFTFFVVDALRLSRGFVRCLGDLTVPTGSSEERKWARPPIHDYRERIRGYWNTPMRLGG